LRKPNPPEIGRKISGIPTIRIRVVALLAALIAALASTLVSGTPASAESSCYQTSCNNVSPIGTDCAASSQIVEVAATDWGNASLVYSSLCDAYWSAIENHGASSIFGGMYYVPQLGGTEVEKNLSPAAHETSTGVMISATYSVKSCLTYESQNFDPAPEESLLTGSTGGCTKWH
jgi:hypothetical protein